MKKEVVILVLLSCHALHADYTGHLPSSIVLQNGENASHNLTATCGNQYCYVGLPSDFNPNAYDFSYSTNNGTSSLTINAAMPQGTTQTLSIFYVGNLSVGSNSKLSLNDFHTLSIQKGLSLGANATLDLTLQKGQKINASEFGPSSKVIFSRNADLTLHSGALLNATNMDFFIIDSKTTIHSGATLKVESNTIRIQNVLQNSGTLEVNGSVWNVGQSTNGVELATSNFSNMEGNVKVGGDFNNGGKPTADTIAGSFWQNDAPSPGGGDLVNYGGTIHITGRLINQQGVEGGRTQNSSVQIYGGKIKVDGGMTNEAHSTLIFGAYKGKMGQLEGSLTNNGKVVVDTAGVAMGSHSLIAGQISGDTNFEVIFRSGANEFIGANVVNGALEIKADSAKIQDFQHTLTDNEKSMINALDKQMNGIYTYGGSSLLRNVARDSVNGVANSFINAPLAILDSMQTYNTSFSHTQNFSIGAFGGGIMSESMGGVMSGVRASYSTSLYSHLLATHFAYGYGSMNQHFETYKGTFQSHALSFSLMDRILLEKINIDIGLHGTFGFFATRDILQFSSTSTAFNSDFNAYNLNANVNISYPFIFQSFSIAPVAGLRQSIITQSPYQNNKALEIQSNGYTNHVTSMILGVNLAYNLNQVSTFFINLAYEPILYHSQKSTSVVLNQQNLTFDTLSSLHTFNMQMGANWQINSNMKTNLNAFYKAGMSSSHIFGVQANFGYEF